MTADKNLSRRCTRMTGIEDPVGIRLWELWYQQKFGDKLDLKIGEQSLD